LAALLMFLSEIQSKTVRTICVLKILKKLAAFSSWKKECFTCGGRFLAMF